MGRLAPAVSVLLLILLACSNPSSGARTSPKPDRVPAPPSLQALGAAVERTDRDVTGEAVALARLEAACEYALRYRADKSTRIYLLGRLRKNLDRCTRLVGTPRLRTAGGVVFAEADIRLDEDALKRLALRGPTASVECDWAAARDALREQLGELGLESGGEPDLTIRLRASTRRLFEKDGLMQFEVVLSGRVSGPEPWLDRPETIEVRVRGKVHAVEAEARRSAAGRAAAEWIQRLRETRLLDFLVGVERTIFLQAPDRATEIMKNLGSSDGALPQVRLEHIGDGAARLRVAFESERAARKALNETLEIGERGRSFVAGVPR